MVLVGQKVIHKTFGEGIVINQEDNYLTIDFIQGNKKFVYPDSFKSFITAVDSLVNAAINQEIANCANTVTKVIDTKTEKKDNISTKKHILSPFELVTIGSSKRKYFFVFQNKTYEAEKQSGYLWAPKSLPDGRTVSHWNMMKQVRKGDIIFHSVQKNIVAISIATSDCYSAKQPKELKSEKLWEDDGWKVDSFYTIIKWPIVTSDYMGKILELQPRQYAPFNSVGRGNTGYLFASNFVLSKYFLDLLKVRNTHLSDIESLITS